MPKVPIDYSKTIIYKIVCKDINIKECYVGQTTSFNKRKGQHARNSKNIENLRFNIYVYQIIRENGGWNNWDMVEVEKYNALDKLDAHKRERYWIETLDAKLNKIIPTRTQKEYNQANPEILSKSKKKYNDANKEKNKESKKIWYQKNKDQVKENKRNWYEENREEIKLNYAQNKEANKLKYDQKKDKINAQRRLNNKLKKEQSITSSL